MKTDKNQIFLKKTILDIDIPFPMSANFFHDFYNCTSFARLFISNVCEAGWFGMQTSVFWEPRKFSSKFYCLILEEKVFSETWILTNSKFSRVSYDSH